MTNQRFISLSICPNLDIGFGQRLGYLWQVAQSALMNEQAVESIAHAHSAGLGIVDDASAHSEVGILVEIGMNHTSTCLDDRHLGIVAHEVD